MSEREFRDMELRLIEPAFGSKLTNLIIELDHLRKRRLEGSTHPQIFFQVKNIFHMMESIGSARIEGNRTTLAEYIETKFDRNTKPIPSIREIQNIEAAMLFVEENVKEYSINRAFVSELHKMIVAGLEPPPRGEGDYTPGVTRKSEVKIGQAAHVPPDWIRVDEYMEELFAFIAHEDDPKYDLLKTAIAHHRFVWTHPFTNGNGRTVRLFTYAMLVKMGFNIDEGRILNPTAVFCGDREMYYRMLSRADDGTESGMLEWCEYVLAGLKQEIQKIDLLLDYPYLKNEILLPAIAYSTERKYITEMESKILKRAIERRVMKAGDVSDLFPNKVSAEVSRQLRKLLDSNLLMPEKVGARKYLISFSNNFLLRGIIRILGEKGFLPENQ